MFYSDLRNKFLIYKYHEENHGRESKIEFEVRLSGVYQRMKGSIKITGDEFAADQVSCDIEMSIQLNKNKTEKFIDDVKDKFKGTFYLKSLTTMHNMNDYTCYSNFKLSCDVLENEDKLFTKLDELLIDPFVESLEFLEI